MITKNKNDLIDIIRSTTLDWKGITILEKLISTNQLIYTNFILNHSHSNYYAYHHYDFNKKRFFLETKDKKLNGKKIDISEKKIDELINKLMNSGSSYVEIIPQIEIDLKEDYDSWDAPCFYDSRSTYFEGIAQVKLNYKNNVPHFEVICK